MNVFVVSCDLTICVNTILKVEFALMSRTYKSLHVPKWPNWAGSPVQRANPICPWQDKLLYTQSQGYKLPWYSDIFIPGLPNTAHSCQCSLVPAWVMSEWPGNIIPFPKTFTLLGVHCLSQCDVGSYYQTARTVIKVRETAMNFLVRIFWHFTSLRCLKARKEFCKLCNCVFWNGEKMVGDACAVLSPLPACFFTLVLTDKIHCLEEE